MLSISAAIEDAITVCNVLKPRQQKEPLTSYETPELPFQMVVFHLVEHQKQTYIVMVNSYLGFYEIDRLSDITSKTIIQMKKLFEIHGKPRMIITDKANYYMS